jgi:hypothetical protein
VVVNDVDPISCNNVNFFRVSLIDLRFKFVSLDKISTHLNDLVPSHFASCTLLLQVKMLFKNTEYLMVFFVPSC